MDRVLSNELTLRRNTRFILFTSNRFHRRDRFLHTTNVRGILIKSYDADNSLNLSID